METRCCDCCVPSEGICLCFIPSQDSRRERSNNFQAFVKMALETLLGSCRRKHGGPRGRQGWVHLPSPLHFSPWAYRLGCCVAFQYKLCSPLTEAENESDLHPSPSVVQLIPPLPNLLLSPLAYWMLRYRSQVKLDHCFEQKNSWSPLCNPTLTHPNAMIDCQTVHNFFL